MKLKKLKGLRIAVSVALISALGIGLAACGSSSASTESAETAEAVEEAESTEAAVEEAADEEAETTDVTEESAEEVAEESGEETTSTSSSGGKLDPNTSGATEVSLWHYFDGDSEQDGIVDLCNEYNAMQDVIYVVPTYVSREELMNQYTIGAISGELPDIGMVDSPDMSSYISLGVFEDITDELNEWGEVDHYYEANLSSCKDADGQIYGLPQNTNCLCLAVNLDALEKAGYDSAPTNIDEFYEMAVACTDLADSQYGFAMSMIATDEGSFQLLPWLYSHYNGESVNVDDLTAESAVNALSVLGDLAANDNMSKECVSWTQADAWNQFCAGKAALCMMGTWQLAQTDSIDFDYDVVLLPTGDEGTTTSCIGGENFGVCTGATEKEACIDFIEWFTSSENEARWANIAGKLSTRDDAHPEYEYAQDFFDVFQEELEYATARGPHPQWPTISEAIYTAGQSVIANGADAEAALTTAMATIDPILEANPLP